MADKKEAKVQHCDLCGTEICKSEDGKVTYNLTDDGVLCDKCLEKRETERLEKTFDEPLHRGRF